MTILFVNEHLFIPSKGGIERVTDDIVRGLSQRNGFSFIYLAANAQEMDAKYDFPAKTLILPKEGGFKVAENVSFYKKLLRDYSVDIVVNQRGWKPFMDNVLNAEGIPTISVVHSSLMGALYLYMAECMNHNNSFDGWWRYIVKLLLYVPYKLYKYLSYRFYLMHHYKLLVRESKRVVLLSHGDAKELRKVTSCSEKHVCVIPNPLVLPNKEEAQSNKKKQLLYIGRLCKTEKNPIRLLKIWRRLYLSFPDWSLVIVGCGDAESEMKRYVEINKLPRVSFEGHQTSVDKYYKSASIVCLTSNFEGWGLVLTEGMAYECIPFTFDNYGAAQEIIDDGINGCLVKAFSLKQYVEKLAFVMSNDDKRKEMAKAARIKSQNFSVSSICDKWENLFNSLCV